MKYKRLPLLDYLSMSLENSSYKDVLIVAGQHLLYSNYVMFSYLFDAGFKPENLFIIGKSYSTDHEVSKKFIQRGSYVHDYMYLSRVEFEKQYAEAVNDFLAVIKARINFSKVKRVIIVDDGGFLIKAINFDEEITKLKITAVEQTTSGYERIKNISIKFPIINVARSWLKLKYESPFIAEALVNQLYKSIPDQINMIRKVLIVGAGSIGNNIYNLLNDAFDVQIYDIIKEKSQIEKLELYDILSKYDLIIGCTGKTIILQKDYSRLKKNVVLMSASTLDREFDAVHIRRNTVGDGSIHDNISTKNLILLNSGFPINFVGHEIERKENIQLTRVLIFSAIIQANTLNKEIGILNLDTRIQNKIVLKYKKLLKESIIEKQK